MGVEGVIYYVDLSEGKVWTETLPEDVYRRYPGGSALATYLLLKHMPKGADPLGPDNVLVMATSPLAGLAISGQSRMTAAARSPLTGAVGDSQSGGFFPAEMKSAGADAIVFLGRSPEPVYLWLKDGRVELRPARHLWGKPTGEVDRLLKEEVGDHNAQVAQAGPAGENGVRFAAIMNIANRANGRTGMGAVMGAKNLKAVAVRGTRRPRAADPERLKALVKRLGELQQENPGIVWFGQYGTAGIVAQQNHVGGLPTHNYGSGRFERAAQITGEVLHDTVLKSRDTCYACAVRCKRVVEIPGEVDPVYGGPEYETIATFGSYCGVNDLKAICKANEICNKYGMDTISCGATIAWAMECFEHGLLGPADTGGIDLRFGNAEAVVRVAEMIALRQGIGDLLAEGSRRAAERLGPEAVDLTTTVKGQELPAHMPQVKRSLGLIYAVNPFGADHQSSEHDTALLAQPGSVERRRLEELGFSERMKPRELGPAKVRFAYYSQVFYSLLDTLGLCQFVFGPSWQLYGPSDVVELVEAATGWQTSLFELMKAGERRLNLLRAFNAREGIGREQDRLPARLFRSLQGGPTDGVALSHEEMESALDLYYRMAGWNPATGKPERWKLQELELDWVAADGMMV